MGVLDDLLARLAPSPDDPIAQFLGVRNNRRRLATEAAGVPFGSLGAGMEVPSSFAPPSAPPPIVQQPPVAFDAAGAGNMPPPQAPAPMASAAPAIEPPAASPPGPQPKEVDGTVVPPTDVSSASPQAAPGPPLNIVPPPQAPAAAPEQPFSFGRLAGNVMDGLKNNSATLLALGAGFAGAPNIGQGISRAAAGAIPASQADLKNRLLLQGQNQTYSALIKRGVAEDVARAAMLNPEILKQVLPSAFGPKAYTFQTLPDGTIIRMDPSGKEDPKPIYQAPVKPELKEGGSDPFTGQKQWLVWDPKTQTMRPASGPQDSPNALPQATMLAPGVTQLDRTLTGDDYVKQFGPEVQAAVKAYINGDVLPSGNPRKDGINSIAKTIAQKWGVDTGTPVSDALFSEKRKYRTELGSTGATTAGGAIKAFNQGIEHASALADKLEGLKNYDPVGVPLVASAINSTRQALSTKQKGLADEAATLGQTLAGEVGKLFSGSAGGGVHERELTRKRFNTVSSPNELAGALEGTIETMEGGLKALEQRRDQVLGPNSGVEFVTKETQAKIAKIKDVIARLKGEAPPVAAPAAAAPAPVPPASKVGERKQFKQGWGVWNGTAWEPEK